MACLDSLVHSLTGWKDPGGAIVFFFFSSRRRHTRFDCDWSSDVCSSDLSGGQQPNSNHGWTRMHTDKTFLTQRDRKSTRLNSSHSQISYAVFCLKKKSTIAHSRKTHCHNLSLQLTQRHIFGPPTSLQRCA